MADLSGLAAALGLLGDTMTAPLGGLAKGALLAPSIEGQSQANAQSRQMFPLHMQAAQQALGRPQTHAMGNNRILITNPDGSMRIQDLPPEAPTPLQQQQIETAKATQKWREAQAAGSGQAKGTPIAQIEAKVARGEPLTPGEQLVYNAHHKPTAESHSRDALAALAADPSQPAELRARAKAMLAEIEASHKRTNPTMGGIQLSPEAIAREAQNINAGGQLPALGMGAAPTRIQILNEAAKEAGGGGDLAGARLGLGAAKAELNKIAGQRGPIEAFIKTTDANLAAADKLSGEVMRTNVPVYNRAELAVRQNVMGDPNVAKFNAATKTAVDEYAKVILSATGSGAIAEGARAKVENMLSTANTPAQFKAVTQFMREEMGRRKAGYDAQVQQVMQNRPGGGARPAAPAAPAAKRPAIGPDGVPGLLPADTDLSKYPGYRWQ